MVLDRGDRNRGDAVVLVQSKVGTYLLKPCSNSWHRWIDIPGLLYFYHTSSKSMHKELT